MSSTLQISEIYLSVQGESSFAGWPCIFIRLTGCSLRCSYCDTAYAFTGGDRHSLADICARVGELAAPFLHRSAAARLPLVEITGGEPLLQPAALPLMRQLCDDGFTVLLETSGALEIASVDTRVRRIVDLKCPSSGESDRNHWPNVAQLKPSDELKFVIATREDYTWAKAVLTKHQLSSRCPVLFSWAAPLTPDQHHPSLKRAPEHQVPLSRAELVAAILADALPVRFQLQLHKVVWPPDQRGV